MATATRTINPLHFEDLEPHRFEDLVRQLAYDLRPWSSIEAVGRSGADEGMDIRALEVVSSLESNAETEISDDEGDTFVRAPSEERVWLVQCKRKRAIGPAEVRSIVANDLSQQERPPFAYILVAACDFSKKARDAFRLAVLPFGVQEPHIWGKGEIEDMLFQPKNDHLLFAYFGISLQVRRRSIRSDVRSKLTLKRQLVRELGDLRDRFGKPVLIRDPRDDDYPFIQNEPTAFLKNPKWRYWDWNGHQPPYGLRFVVRRYFAYIDWSTGEWDALFDCDISYPHTDLYGIPLEVHNQWPTPDRWKYSRYWDKNVPKANQGHLYHIGIIPYERIIALDELGDGANEGPHLLVEYRPGNKPFEEKSITYIEATGMYDNRTKRIGEDDTPIDYFPAEIPDTPEAELASNE